MEVISRIKSRPANDVYPINEEYYMKSWKLRLSEDSSFLKSLLALKGVEQVRSGTFPVYVVTLVRSKKVVKHLKVSGNLGRWYITYSEAKKI